MKTIVVLILVALTVLAQGSYFRFVHASPDAPNVDVLLNNVKILNNIAYGNVSEYGYYGETGGFHIQVFPTGKTDPILVDTTANWPTLTEPWTLFVVDYLKQLSSILEKDALGLIKDGRSAIRFAHLSPDAPNADVMLNGNMTVFQNVPFKTITDYVLLDVGAYVVHVAATGTTSPSISLDVSLQAWVLYTVMAIGSFDGSPALTLLIRYDI